MATVIFSNSICNSPNHMVQGVCSSHLSDTLCLLKSPMAAAAKFRMSVSTRDSVSQHRTSLARSVCHGAVLVRQDSIESYMGKERRGDITSGKESLHCCP